MRWAVPDGTSWSEEQFLACFNDDCPYYRDGWEWMSAQYGQRASFRFAVSPLTGASLMIPVWSPSACRDRILPGAVAGAAR